MGAAELLALAAGGVAVVGFFMATAGFRTLARIYSRGWPGSAEEDPPREQVE